MWIIIGFIIIIYAVIALIVLYKWRNNILKFVLEIFTDTDEVLKEAETILPPIQDTASDVRQIAESIHGVGDEIIRVIPPALESIAEEMGNLNASIQDFEREAGGQLDDLGETIRESLNNLIELLNDQSTTSIPAVTDLLRTVSLQIDELEWYKLTSSVVEQLNDDFSIPTSVTDKLSDLIDLEYPNRESFIQALDQRLEDAEHMADAGERAWNAHTAASVGGDVAALEKQLRNLAALTRAALVMYADLEEWKRETAELENYEEEQP